MSAGGAILLAGLALGAILAGLLVGHLNAALLARWRRKDGGRG